MKITIAFKHKLSDNFFERMKQKIILKWTKSIYFHVEMIIDNEWIEADNDKGLIKHKLRPLSTKYDYITIYVPECQINLKNAKKFIENQMGSKYDWTGIYLSQVFKLGIDKKDRWFCSEIVSKMLQIYGVENFHYIKPEDMSPESVFKMLSAMESVDLSLNYSNG